MGAGFSVMSEFARVATVADMETLDMVDVQAGYYAGRHGAPEPIASYFSRAFVHGWRNGAVDGGHREQDEAQAMLAREYTAMQGVRH
jgi:uncharacterized membrane protein